MATSRVSRDGDMMRGAEGILVPVHGVLREGSMHMHYCRRDSDS
jgi:hypothetical protein